VLGVVWFACAGEPREEPKGDAELGLSKESVFSTPEPIVPATKAKDPGENETREAYFSGAPPVIPHLVEDSLPIKVGENMCMDCHDLPDQIGVKREHGEPTPMPESHYMDLRRSPDKVTKKVIGARYFCVQCHAPQADAEPLVANTLDQ
jgi:cytochrome c-type protein NapB